MWTPGKSDCIVDIGSVNEKALEQVVLGCPGVQRRSNDGESKKR